MTRSLSASVWLLLSALVCLPSGFASEARAEGPKPIVAADYPGTIQVACIGDSITQGIGSTKPWVKMLGEAFGSKWKFHNFGISARTLLTHGDFPYVKEKQWPKVLELKPDVVLIALGTNDSKPHNWKHKAEFAGDYRKLIDDLRLANPKVRIYCLLPIPAYPANFGITDEVISKEVLPLVRKVAADAKCDLIDLNTPMLEKATFVPDKVHPNIDGHRLMAGTIYEALAGTKAPTDAIK
ncbi:MAG: sialate O-acetylesterase [Planctomycetia bacterium]|nr:sialate O-acetylesterase [Planctomycetia bacterium]